MSGKAAWVPKINVLDTEGDRWNPTNEDEFLFWPRVLWIDPGTVSGVAVVWFDPHAVFAGDIPLARQVLAYSEMFLSGPENGPNGQVNRYLRMRKTLAQAPGCVAGCESFVPLKFNQSSEFYSPIRIRAGIEARLSMTSQIDSQAEGEDGGVPLLTQSPNDAITSFTNDRLGRLRMYTPGPDHINDAKRHALLHIRRLQQRGFDDFVRYYGENEEWWT